jgi:hypothetical protein
MLTVVPGRAILLAAATLAVQLAGLRSPAPAPRTPPSSIASPISVTVVAAPAVESPAALRARLAKQFYPYGPCPDLDLDGDGVTDRFDVVPDSCGTGGCQYDLFLVRPDGADRGVGRVEGLCQMFTLGRKRHGLAELDGTWSLGVEQVKTWYRFDGQKYRAIRVESCRYDTELGQEVCKRQ